MTQMEVAGSVPEFDLCDRLRKARELTGLGQREFAARLGIAKATVTNAEKGHRMISRPTLNAWSLATGVSSVWLATGRDDSAPGRPPSRPVQWLPRLDSNQQPSGSRFPQVRRLEVAA